MASTIKRCSEATLPAETSVPLPPISVSFALRRTEPSAATCPMMIPPAGIPSVPASSVVLAQTLSPPRESRMGRDGCQSLPVMESLVWELAAMSEIDGNGSRRRDLSKDRCVELAEEDGRVEKNRAHLAPQIVYAPSHGDKCLVHSTCRGLNAFRVCSGARDDESCSDERDCLRKADDRKDCSSVTGDCLDSSGALCGGNNDDGYYGVNEDGCCSLNEECSGECCTEYCSDCSRADLFREFEEDHCGECDDGDCRTDFRTSPQRSSDASSSSPSSLLTTFPLSPSAFSAAIPSHLRFLVRSGALNDFSLGLHYLTAKDEPDRCCGSSAASIAPPDDAVSAASADAVSAASADAVSAVSADAVSAASADAFLISKSLSSAAAAAWFFRCAAVRGMEKAVYNLGVCYATGNGVKKDEKMAANLFRRAADGGHPNSMYAYSHHLLQTSNSPVGPRMMLEAAEAGSINAILYSAVDLCFLDGAKSRLRSIASSTSTSTSTGCSSSSTGGSDGRERGVRLLKRAVVRNNAEATFLLGSLTATGGAGLNKDEKLAEVLFDKATKLGLNMNG